MYDNHKALGLCVKCSEPAVSGITLCDKHRVIKNSRHYPNESVNKANYRENHREEIREKNRNYIKVVRATDKWFEWYLLHHYNITIEGYNSMWEKQGGICAIPSCGWPLDSGPKRPHVDHAHATGKFRGLLCGNHNKVLGLIKEREEELLGLVEYLRNTREGL